MTGRTHYQQCDTKLHMILLFVLGISSAILVPTRAYVFSKTPLLDEGHGDLDNYETVMAKRTPGFVRIGRHGNFVRIGRPSSFVRIGRGGSDDADGDEYVEQQDNDVSQSGGEGRWYSLLHRFIRIGRQPRNGVYPENELSKPQSMLEGNDNVMSPMILERDSVDDDDDSDILDEYNSKRSRGFVRIGKRSTRQSNPKEELEGLKGQTEKMKRSKGFVRIGKAPEKYEFLTDDKHLGAKRRANGFVRIGKMSQFGNDKTTGSNGFTHIEEDDIDSRARIHFNDGFIPPQQAKESDNAEVNDVNVNRRASNFMRIGKLDPQSDGMMSSYNMNKKASNFVRIGKLNPASGTVMNNFDINRRASNFVGIGKLDPTSSDRLDTYDINRRTSNFVRIGKADIKSSHEENEELSSDSKGNNDDITPLTAMGVNQEVDKRANLETDKSNGSLKSQGKILKPSRRSAFVRIGKIPSTAFVRIGKNYDRLIEVPFWGGNSGERKGRSTFVRIG